MIIDGFIDSPNSVYTEGFWRLGKDIHERRGTYLGSVARQLLLLFTVLGEGRARLVYAKRSVAPLSTVKHNGFGTNIILFASDCLLVAPGHLGTRLPPDSFQIASQLLPDCLQVAHLTLIGVSRCSHIVALMPSHHK